jgi:hypothetical protein
MHFDLYSLHRPTIGYFQHFGTSITNAYSTHFVKSSGLNAKAKFHYTSVPRFGSHKQTSTLTTLFINRVGQNQIYTVSIQYNWQENRQIYGHIQLNMRF